MVQIDSLKGYLAIRDENAKTCSHKLFTPCEEIYLVKCVFFIAEIVRGNAIVLLLTLRLRLEAGNE